jgi:hypothetical protein
MRNVVLADASAFAHDVPSAVIAVYADGPDFATAKKVHTGNLGYRPIPAHNW